MDEKFTKDEELLESDSDESEELKNKINSDEELLEDDSDESEDQYESEDDPEELDDSNEDQYESEEETSMEKELNKISENELKELDNEIQNRYNNVKEFLNVFFAASLFCIGVFLFIYYLPISFDEQTNLWRNFSNNCCSRIQNETRCLLTYGCKHNLNCWIELQNSTRDFMSECCYWFSTYKKKELLLHCNPNCFQ